MEHLSYLRLFEFYRMVCEIERKEEFVNFDKNVSFNFNNTKYCEEFNNA